MESFKRFNKLSKEFKTETGDYISYYYYSFNFFIYYNLPSKDPSFPLLK